MIICNIYKVFHAILDIFSILPYREIRRLVQIAFIAVLNKIRVFIHVEVFSEVTVDL